MGDGGGGWEQNLAVRVRLFTRATITATTTTRTTDTKTTTTTTTAALKLRSSPVPSRPQAAEDLNFKAGVFEAGPTRVALSRARALEGLPMLGYDSSIRATVLPA